MQRSPSPAASPSVLKGSIVALGNFDGFHLGHQAVVGRAVQRGLSRAAAGDRRDLRAAPGAPLQARRAAVPADHARPARAAVRAAGADAMLVFDFDEKLPATTSAEEFVARLLAASSARRAS